MDLQSLSSVSTVKLAYTDSIYICVCVCLYIYCIALNYVALRFTTLQYNTYHYTKWPKIALYHTTYVTLPYQTQYHTSLQH